LLDSLLQESLAMKSCILLLACVGFAAAAPMEDEEPPCRTGDRFGDQEYCDKFYECDLSTEEVYHEHDCSDGLVYSEERESCEFPQMVDCSERPLRQEPQPSEGCERMNGYFRVADSCKSYNLCNNGDAFPKTCGPGLAYNPNTTTCVWPHDLPLDSECTKELVELEEGLEQCPEKPVGYPYNEIRWAHDDCNKFWFCIDGLSKDVLSGCDKGLVYNAATYSCDLPENLDREDPCYSPPEE